MIDKSSRKSLAHHALVVLAALLLLLAGGGTASAVDVDTPPGGSVPGTGAEANPPTIFLTFDDGPYQPWTQQILDVLAEYNAHAIFFMIGRQAISEPDTLKQIYDAGNALGNHSFNHANLTGVSQQFFNAEVGDTGALFGDMNSMCLRPPYGAIDYNVVDYAEQLGYSVVKWNMDPEDWRAPGASVIARHVIDNARDGSIVVMHDGGGDRTQTVAALRVILKTLTAKGFKFKALCRDYPMDSLTEPLLATATPDPLASPAPVTETPTATATATPTETPTATATATPSPTSTATSTETSTATSTETSTETPTETPTGTSTETPTGTSTETPTGTSTETSTGTPTGTSTETPTGTSTETPTGTSTETSTGTPTEPPTETPALTPASTPLAAASPSAAIPPVATRALYAAALAPATPFAAPHAIVPVVPDGASHTPTATPDPNAVYGRITFPDSGSTVSGAVLVQGFADHPDFAKWQIDLLVDGEAPAFLGKGDVPLPTVRRLVVWNTTKFPNGPHMLRLRVVFDDGNYAEYFTHVTVSN